MVESGGNPATLDIYPALMLRIKAYSGPWQRAPNELPGRFLWAKEAGELVFDCVKLYTRPGEESTGRIVGPLVVSQVEGFADRWRLRQFMGVMAPDPRDIEEMRVADGFLKSCPYDECNPYPLWHGWAMRDAFFAGIDWERQRREKCRDDRCPD